MVEAKIGLTLSCEDEEDAIPILDNVKELIDNSGLQGIKEVWWEGDDINEISDEQLPESICDDGSIAK